MATWSKLFSNFIWKNRPDTSTPLGQTFLNRLNNAINGIDDRVVTLNAEKASTDDLNGSIVNVRLDEKTGIFTFTRFDGTTFTINTALEEVVTNFVYDYATQSLVLTLADGTTQNIDLSALITQYEFTSSATILFTVGTDGKVTANIKPNSITDQMLQTNYLADITTQANTAVSASQSALESQSLAEQSAEDADRHADRAEAAADRAEAITGFTVDMNLDKNSSNPIANKAVAEALENVDAKTLGGHGAEYFAKGTDLVNYLPKTGGKLNSGTNNPLELENLTSDTVRIRFSGASGILGYIGVDGKGRFVALSPEDWATRDILHTGNKPTGTYTGNGDATIRTINTGGIGNAVVVWGNGGMFVATPSGIIGGTNGSNTGNYGAGHFTNGVLTIGSDSVILNKSGAVYTYQVL